MGICEHGRRSRQSDECGKKRKLKFASDGSKQMSDSDEHSDDANDEDDAGNADAVPTTADACVVSNDEDDNGKDAPSTLRHGPKRIHYQDHQIKHLSTRQMFASQNFNLNGVAFWKRWQEETRDYGARVKVRKDRKESKKKARVERKAKKLERAQVRTESKERDVAHRRDARGFDQLLRQNTVLEKLEERGKGGYCIAPTDVLHDDSNNRIRILTVAPKSIPIIRIGGKRAQSVFKLLAEHDAKPFKRKRDPCGARRCEARPPNVEYVE